MDLIEREGDLPLKCQQKSSKNAVCESHLLHLFANIIRHVNIRANSLDPDQTWTQIRLLLEQSDLGPHCFSKGYLNNNKAVDFGCDWHLKVNMWYSLISRSPFFSVLAKSQTSLLSYREQV